MLVEKPERISCDDEDLHTLEVSRTDQVMLVFSTVISKVKSFQFIEITRNKSFSVNTCTIMDSYSLLPLKRFLETSRSFSLGIEAKEAHNLAAF